MHASSPLQVCLLTAFRMLTILAVPAALITTAAFFSDDHSLLAQASPFRLQYGVLLAAHTLLCLAARRPRWAGFFAVCAIFNLLVVALPTMAPLAGSGSSAAPSTRLHILYVNVHTENTDATPLLALIAAESPDLVALVEVNHRWALDLANALGADYPHRYIREREDNFGAALFSRVRLGKPATKYFSAAEVPSLAATLPLPSGSTRLLLTHPLPPADADGTRWRNEQLKALADWTTTDHAPTVILGDFNATPWCPSFSHLRQQAHLHLASTGHVLYPATWPVAPHQLRIPIDHVLLSEEWSCSDYRVGPNIGSDHFPLIITLTLPADPHDHRQPRTQ